MQILQQVLLVLMIVAGVVMTAAILILPPKENSMGQAIGGSDELNLFGKKKSHGIINLLERTVICSSAVFMLSAFLYNVLLRYI